MDKATRIEDVMTPNPTILRGETTVAEAARLMREEDIGLVLVCDDREELIGTLSDRDIVVRCVAEGNDCRNTKLTQVCSRDLVKVERDASIRDVVRLMAEYGVRRIPICDEDKVIGVVSLGDLALARDPESALGAISSCPPNH